MEVFEAIRRDRRAGMSIHGLAERHDVHRRTVRQALDCAAPLPRKVPVRRSARPEGLKALSTRCWSRTWMRRVSSVIRRGGCWPGWLMSMA